MGELCFTPTYASAPATAGAAMVIGQLGCMALSMRASAAVSN